MLFNVRSSYSLLKSTIRIRNLVELAKKRGYSALGLSDINVMHGALEFYNTCCHLGIKPLMGLAVELKGIVYADRTFPFLLYARNSNGYRHLMQVSSLLNRERVVDKEVWRYLSEVAEDVVMITAGRVSELEQALIHDEVVHAEQIIQLWRQTFGEHNVFVGVSIYPFNSLEVDRLYNFVNRWQLPLVMNQLVQTLDSRDAFSLKVLRAIESNETVDIRLQEMQGANYLYDYSDLVAMYERENLGQCVANTVELVSELNVEIPQHQKLLPAFDTPYPLSSSEYLRQLTDTALTRLGKQSNDYKDRLNLELSVINQMGFSDYFLIVWDIMDYCHREKIRTGPGRGSAAGSLVSYLLGITLVDPIEYDLLFERFLNPERMSMPDIDIDIPDNQREKVLRYIEKRYGHQQVAQIVTFGTFGAKQAVRDTLRVLGYTADTLKRWAKVIPTELNMTLQKAYDSTLAFRQLVASSSDFMHVLRIAQQIEGLPRHVSTHAAAVVIHDQPLSNIIPVMERGESRLMTQFTMYDVERIGLLKMDFLGLRNLSLLEDIIQNIQQKSPNFDIKEIDFHDNLTLELFRKADTLGVFQFESDGIRHVLRKVQVASFEDIVAVNALFRPGPMKQIDTFVERKNGKGDARYFHESLKPILQKTYGIMVYQEQVMQVCQVLAGFTLGQADLLRRAMSKKQMDVMEKERQHFIEGAMARHISYEVAEQVYNHIQEFASYGFNRSHAVVYSTLAYQLAYLKVHYPLEFYQALLNQSPAPHYVQDAKQKLGQISPLNINRSQAGFSVQEQHLMLGFSSIRGLRKEWLDYLLNDRQLVGNYASLTQFLQRMPKKFIKQEVIESFIIAGAFDETGYNRATLMHNLPTLLKSVEFSGNNIQLFAALEPKIQWVEEWPLLERLEKEKALLGFTLSGHPLDELNHLFVKDSQLMRLEQVLIAQPNQFVKTLALVKRVKIIQTKRNEPMAFVALSSEMAECSLVVFPNVYYQTQTLLKENTILSIEGKVEYNQRGELQLIAQRIAVPVVHEVVEQGNMTCFIRIDDWSGAQLKIEQLKQLAIELAGPARIVLVDKHRKTWQLDEPYCISYSNKAKQRLAQIFGDENVIFK